MNKMKWNGMPGFADRPRRPKARKRKEPSMNQESPSMLDLVIELHKSLDRLGPGSAEATERALGFIDGIDSMGRVLDLGCGTGAQTFVLAKHIPGAITGVDLFPDFIDVFNARAEKLGLQGRVVGKQGSMDDLDIPFESVDLIWCEGAIDGVGFAKMLAYWKAFLKPGGYVGITCPSWLTAARVDEVDEFWTQAGSGLDTVADNVAALQDAGYATVATFVLPKACWTENYFVPRRAAESGLLKKYPDSKAVEEFIAGNHYEESLFSEHGDRYGYVFYIAKKI